MPDHSHSDDSFTSVRAFKEAAIEELRTLRFIGQATAETLADESITADDIREQAVTYLQLVESGVDPGVAARIRREHSLPWSNEAAKGPRLKRRAQHIRNLRDDERSWIDRSWTAASSETSSTQGAASDGSGSAAEAERAWQERSRSGSAKEQGSGPRPDARTPGAKAESGPPIDPREHTVSELKDAIAHIEDTKFLVEILQAEHAGDDRTTALEAINRRLRALGADPEQVARQTVGDASDASKGEAGVFHLLGNLVDGRIRELREVDAERTREAISTVKAVGAELDKPLARYRAAARNRIATAERAWHRHEVRIRTIESEDWKRLSVALLLGLITFSGMAALITTLGSTGGAPMSVLSWFLVTLVVGVVTVPLHWWDAAGGYWLSLVTGLVGLATVGFIAGGTSGTPTLVTTPVTLSLYGLISAFLLTTTYLSHGGGFRSYRFA